MYGPRTEHGYVEISVGEGGLRLGWSNGLAKLPSKQSSGWTGQTDTV